MSLREVKEVKKALDDLAVEMLRKEIAPLIGVIPMTEDWEPYPDPDEIEYEELTPFYSTRREAEQAQRRAARKKPASLQE